MSPIRVCSLFHVFLCPSLSVNSSMHLSILPCALYQYLMCVYHLFWYHPSFLVSLRFMFHFLFCKHQHWYVRRVSEVSPTAVRWLQVKAPIIQILMKKMKSPPNSSPTQIAYLHAQTSVHSTSLGSNGFGQAFEITFVQFEHDAHPCRWMYKCICTAHMCNL